MEVNASTPGVVHIDEGHAAIDDQNVLGPLPLERIRRDLQSRDIAIFASILNKHKRFIPGWIYRSIAR